ncbi:MAG TPA: hypothetical protein VG013_39670 [Gemmataceae bacterium]|jgi:hypothetical protein|nr:hypothetical protein [Gemmataceae bacterium]
MAALAPDNVQAADVGPEGALDPATVLTGTLHVFVAFDWAEEVDLDRARSLVPAEFHELPRRRRTPSSIAYRPPPLRFALAPLSLDLPELSAVQARAEATVFDFAAVSLGLHVPFRLPAAGLSRLAGWLAEPTVMVQAARAALKPLHQRLLPALQKPLWNDDLSEEYFVFHLAPAAPPSPAAQVLAATAPWLAGLVRLEAGPLSPEEVAEALRLHLSYRPDDLFIADWAAAVLLDRDCDETLQTIEFANLQLLEFRHIDNRLDDSLAAAYRLVYPLSRSWLPFWRSYARPLRALGSLKVEANGLFERTENVLKLVGDQYLARVYRLLATRFHLDEWEQNIQRKLEVGEGVYQVVSNQAATNRTEALEAIVIVLIVLEIVLALVRH